VLTLPQCVRCDAILPEREVQWRTSTEYDRPKSWHQSFAALCRAFGDPDRETLQHLLSEDPCTLSIGTDAGKFRSEEDA